MDEIPAHRRALGNPRSGGDHFIDAAEENAEAVNLDAKRRAEAASEAGGEAVDATIVTDAPLAGTGEAIQIEPAEGADALPTQDAGASEESARLGRRGRDAG